MTIKLTATERVYLAMKNAIITGRYPPETHLTANGVAQHLSVSRTPVREGLRRLHSEGLVNLVVNHGAFVSSWSMSEMAEIYALRVLLEGRAAELAAQRLTDQQIDELKSWADGMETSAASSDPDRLSAIADANDKFHMLITEAASSHRLATSLAMLLEVPLALRTFGRYSEEQLQRSMQHHRELIAAFIERDAVWARAAMECHVNSARAIYTRAARESSQSQ